MEISLAVAACLIFAAIISHEFKVSSAVLEVLAGMILGVFIADLHSVGWLHYLSGIGVLALMFVAGFELRLQQLKQTWRPSMAIGLSSFGLPFMGVLMTMHYWLGMEWLASMLIAVGLSTTSLALVYHLMKEHKILATREGQILFGAASIVDIVSMVVLAVVLGEMGLGTLMFGAIFVVCVFIIPHSARWLFERYANNISEPEIRFLMVIIVAMSFMAESLAHVHPALIAFALGVFMSRFIERNEEVKNKFMALVFGFFAPLFFLQSGSKIDLSDLNSKYMIIFAVVFLVATSLKFLGTYIPARFSVPQLAAYSGKIFNFRLSFGIIAANIGLEQELIEPAMYGVIMLVVISSAAIPSILIRNVQFSSREVEEIDIDKPPDS